MFLWKVGVMLIVMSNFSGISWGGTNTCKELPQKISACQPYSCKWSSPMVSNFVSEKRVVGKSGDRCRFEELLPNGIKMECQFKDSSLPIVAEITKNTLAGVVAKDGGKNAAYNPMTSGECKMSGYGKKRN